MNASRHFDAPPAATTSHRVLGLIATRWGIAIAWMVVVAIIGAAAFGLLFLDRLKTVAIETAVASTPLFVVIDPTATAVEVDAIGPRIKATPGVADATPRPRDAALQALVANGLPAPEGRNPLPDVWVVRPNAEIVGDAAQGFATTIVQLRTALAALPQVNAVRVDELWIGQLDAAIGEGRRAETGLLQVGGALLAILLVCVGWIGATAMASGSKEDLKKSVLALTSAIISVAALILDAIVIGIASAIGQPNAPGVVHATWARLGLTAPTPIILTTVSILLVSGIAAAAARPSRR